MGLRRGVGVGAAVAHKSTTNATSSSSSGQEQHQQQQQQHHGSASASASSSAARGGNTNTANNNSSSSNSTTSVGAPTGGDAKTQLELLSKKLNQQRLTDIAKSAEMLEKGIRTFIEANKDEIRSNTFLREKVRMLAESCNIDLQAAIATNPRLKPSSMLGDFLWSSVARLPLVGSSSSSSSSAPSGGNSATGAAAASSTTATASIGMRKFYNFLSSRVVTFCVRERLLRGPIIPMSVVLNEMRKRYPLEEICLQDIVRSIETLAPLNPNVFVLHQDTCLVDEKTGKVARPSSWTDADELATYFVAFKQISLASDFETPDADGAAAGTTTAASDRHHHHHHHQHQVGASGSDALRILVLAGDLAKMRRKRRQKMLSSSTSASSPAGATASILRGPAGFTTSSSSMMAAKRQQQQQQQQTMSAVSVADLGIVEDLSHSDDAVTGVGGGSGAAYVRLTAAEIVKLLGAGDVWALSRATMALKAALELCEGWWDEEDRSIWLLVTAS